MAKTRAQRKAERRRREAAQAAREGDGAAEARAQQRTQVPESADVIEAELAERGADLDHLASETAEQADAERATAAVETTAAPAPSRADVGRPAEAEEAAPDRISRRERKRSEREKARRAKESVERRQRSQAAAP